MADIKSDYFGEATEVEPTTLHKALWFWYSILCALCFAGWALFSKLASREIPARTVQLLFTLGTVPVALVLLAMRRFKLEKSPKGISYAVANGVLGGLGSIWLFCAFRAGGNTSVITTITGLYPIVTVVLAILILRERLTKRQFLGLAFAVVALVIFSL